MKKRILSIVLSMITCFMIVLPAFAAETTQYKENEEIIISGKTDFDYFYTYTTKSSIDYKCFSLTLDGQRYYAAVIPDKYEYYRQAFTEHSLTLQGRYQFTAGDGAPVVIVTTLVEGEKKTALDDYLWKLNCGSSAKPNFKAYYDLYNDGTLSIASDSSYIEVDTNPLNMSADSALTKLFTIVGTTQILRLNSFLGLPDWLYEEMTKTRAIDGRQKESFDNVTVTWSYHPNKGLEIVYRKNQ